MAGNVHKKNHGVALLFVMGTVAVISIIAIQMASRVQITKMSLVQRRDSTKALELAKAGFRWSVFRLQLDQNLDGIRAIPGTNFGGKKDDLTEVQWTFPLTYPFPTVNAAGNMVNPDQETQDQLDENGSFSSVITDESARINLNDVGSATIQAGTPWSGAAAVLVNLLASPRFSSYFGRKSSQNILEVPRAIDDWTDNDNQVNYLRGGDENSEYRVDGDRYKVKNGPLYTVEELRLLKPITPELFQELKPFVTVYPFNAKIPRVSAQPIKPQGKININTAPVELIAAIFSQSAMTSNRARLECAQKFAKARSGTAFRSVQQGGAEPNLLSFLQQNCPAPAGATNSFIDQQVLAILDVASNVFRIQASGYVGDIEKRVEAVVLRSNEAPKVLYWKVY